MNSQFPLSSVRTNSPAQDVSSRQAPYHGLVIWSLQAFNVVTIDPAQTVGSLDQLLSQAGLRPARHPHFDRLVAQDPACYQSLWIGPKGKLSLVKFLGHLRVPVFCVVRLANLAELKEMADAGADVCGEQNEVQNAEMSKDRDAINAEAAGTVVEPAREREPVPAGPKSVGASVPRIQPAAASNPADTVKAVHAAGGLKRVRPSSEGAAAASRSPSIGARTQSNLPAEDGCPS